MDLKKLSKDDPLDRMAEKSADTEGMSPMDPPDAYSPPSTEDVAYDTMHPFLQELMDDHKRLIAQMTTFEEAQQQIQTSGLSNETGQTLRNSFQFFEEDFIVHNRKEEVGFFPLLKRRLIESGEHGATAERKTGVDVMQNDHTRAVQLAAVACSFFGLAVRLPDEQSRMLTLSGAVQQSKDLIEHVRLHIFREETILFGFANNHFSAEELDQFQTSVETETGKPA